MTRRRSGIVGAAAVMACLGSAPQLSAQGIEVEPFAGYRFGGDFFELVAGRPVDIDGAMARGAVLNVPVSNGLQFEGMFTHQRADIWVPSAALLPPTPWQVSVDHWQGGALQELGAGRARPFMTISVGLTRYAVEADSEYRLALSGGGGAKLFPTESLGFRVDGRVFATVIDTAGTAVACAPGACFFSIHANVVWQAEFTAGIIVRFR